MNNRRWSKQEEADALLLDKDVFLTKYPHRSADGLRIRKASLEMQPAPTPAAIDADVDDEDIESNYDRYFRLVKEQVATEMKLGSSVDLVEYEFNDPDQKPIGIGVFSDAHVGAGGVLYDILERDMQILRDTAGLYGVFNGDVLENTKTHTKSASALYTAAVPNPKHQLEWARREFSLPLTRINMGGDHPWLCWTEGNHDAFDYRAAGVDRIADLAAELGTPYFKEKGGTLKIDVGGIMYTMIVKHQYTGQSKISKANSARRAWTEWPHHWDNADIVALSHLHEPDLHVTMQKGRDVHLLRSGSYKVKDGWAEANGFKPSYGVPVVILHPRERKIQSFHGLQFVEAVEYLKMIRGEA